MQASVLEMMNMKGKVAVVTGAYANLGFDMACALAELGCNIVVTSRDIEKAKQAADKIAKDYKVETLGVQMELTNYESIEKSIKEAYEFKNRIDVLINNAGGGGVYDETNILKRSPKSIEAMITINLTGTIYCCKAAAKYMAEAKSGRIINIASIAGMIGRDRQMYYRNDKLEQPTDYAAAKAGVIGFSRDLAASLAPYGILVNSISPGGFDKNTMGEDFVNDFANETMVGKMGTMGSDLKGVTVYLGTGLSNYVTGTNVVVDGGFAVFK